MKNFVDGFVPFKSYKTYYKVFGEPQSGKAPLLVLHGGPGSSHNYLLGLSELANERKVVFYDQLGGGTSDKPADNSIWTMELFLEELDVVRRHLKLKGIHILGHSWGGMMAIEYLLRKPSGVHSVTLASSMVSMPLYQQEVNELVADLPASVRDILVKHEQADTTDSEEYVEAMAAYNKRHIYRGGPYSDELKGPKGSFNKASYEKLWGVSETFANGELKDWDRVPRLGEIKIPTLITSGQNDELTPHQAVVTHDNIADSKLRIFTAASHFAHIEKADQYVQTLRDFLNDVETSVPVAGR